MLDNRPKLKQFLLNAMYHPYAVRPRWWMRAFVIPFFIKRGKGSIIRSKARLDIMISKKFEIGYHSVIEYYTIINNGMGDITVGDYSQVTSRVKVVGPVKIGKNVLIGSGAQITGLTHNFRDITRPIQFQGVEPSLTTIEDDVWIGGNTCINQGITIGTHSIVGSGSVVTRNIPPYSVAVGNPARVVQTYDFDKKEWVKVAKK